MSDPVVMTYEPEDVIRRGHASLFREILRELTGSRWLLRQLLKREVVATYKQSILGVGWLILTPLASVVTFLVLDSSGVIDVGEIAVPYPIFAILGMASWQLFSTGLVACTQSLVGAGQMVAKIRFSRKSLVIAAMGRGVVSFAIQIVLVLILLLFYGIWPAPELLLMPLVAVPLVVLTLGLGFVLALLNVVARDVGNVLTTLLMFFLFLTPVLYQKPQSGTFASFSDWNPLYHFVAAGRDLALSGQITQPGGLALASAFALLVFLVGIVVFHVAESRLAERV
jgi:lipopolysaccharide transport system permease protein